VQAGKFGARIPVPTPCWPSATCGPAPFKRVASAVGEGAMAIALVHQYLKEM